MSTKKVESFPSQQPNPDFSGVFDVSTDDVNKHQKEVHLIDVRNPDEFVGEYGHIAGAQLITLGTLPERISELPKEETIIFICRSGRRSAQAVSFALENGFQSVYNMAGGMIAWTDQNFAAEEKN